MGNKWLDRATGLQTGIKSDASKINATPSTSRCSKPAIAAQDSFRHSDPGDAGQAEGSLHPGHQHGVSGRDASMSTASSNRWAPRIEASWGGQYRCLPCGSSSFIPWQARSRPMTVCAADGARLLRSCGPRFIWRSLPIRWCAPWNSAHKVLPRRDVFIGLENYVALAQDEIFWRSVRNTSPGPRSRLRGADPRARPLGRARASSASHE